LCVATCISKIKTFPQLRCIIVASWVCGNSVRSIFMCCVKI
jgi:hypothetical protein